MNQHKRKGRKSVGDRFFQMHTWLINSTAWRHTSVYERSLYFELKTRYNGQNNGDIALAHREAEALLNCSNKPIAAAFQGLIDKGFIKVAQIGSFHWKDRAPGGKSTRWILTEHPIDTPERTLVPTKDFMGWKPPVGENPRYAESIPFVRSKHTTSEVMVRPEHTKKAKVYAHGTR